MTWWSEWRAVYFELMTLTTRDPWGPRKHIVYSDGSFAFHDSEIDGHLDEVEEQLWSFRNGLSNVVYKLHITPRQGRANLRKLMRS